MVPVIGAQEGLEAFLEKINALFVLWQGVHSFEADLTQCFPKVVSNLAILRERLSCRIIDVQLVQVCDDFLAVWASEAGKTSQSIDSLAGSRMS